MRVSLLVTTCLCLALLVWLSPLAPAAAQILPGEDAAAPPAETADPFGRDTPRGAVTGLLDALGSGDHVRAANYFAAPDDEADISEQGAELARQLLAALDAGGTLLPYGALSNDASGRLDDGLAPDLEQVGTFPGDEAPPILLTQTADEGQAGIWRISPQTIEVLGERAPAADAPADAGALVAGAPLGDWALLLGVAAASFLLFWLVAAAILALLRRTVSHPDTRPFYSLIFAALPPLSLFLAVISVNVWAGSIEASIIARQTLLRYIGIVAWVAVAWFALRLVDAVARLATGRMRRRQRRQAVSIVALLRRAAKVLLLAVSLVAILDTLGFDVTAGIAALGIGGLALALGAQKTIENLVGSVTVIADRPVQVGDFCRVGSVVGTVEDIGMRSTRVRTLERTVVTIPNGDFSSREIENFATRDRYLFNPTIGVDYGISAAKLREGVGIIEQVLMEHAFVDHEDARARFADFGASSLDIEVWAYITVPDFNESRLIRQELLLAIYERLEAAGLSIAFPTQTVHLVQETQ